MPEVAFCNRTVARDSALCGAPRHLRKLRRSPEHDASGLFPHHACRHLLQANSMRRRRSDELPRFVREEESISYKWRRRYWLYLAGALFVFWILYPSRSPPDDGSTLRINWSSYAYSLYATDSATLCHAVLLFDALARYGSKADRVLFYPKYWDTIVSNAKDRDSQLLVMARDKYNVKLQPISLLTVEGRTTGTLHMLYRNRSLVTPLRRRPNWAELASIASIIL